MVIDDRMQECKIKDEIRSVLVGIVKVVSIDVPLEVPGFYLRDLEDKYIGEGKLLKEIYPNRLVDEVVDDINETLAKSVWGERLIYERRTK